jgi:hypothetical protein
MKFELWRHEGGVIFCGADSCGDHYRATLDADVWLEREVEASSYLEAMTKYYGFMGWGEYRSDNPELDSQPFD